MQQWVKWVLGMVAASIVGAAAYGATTLSSHGERLTKVETTTKAETESSRAAVEQVRAELSREIESLERTTTQVRDDAQRGLAETREELLEQVDERLTKVETATRTALAEERAKLDETEAELRQQLEVDRETAAQERAEAKQTLGRTRAELLRAVQAEGGRLRVRTTFDLPGETRERLGDALRETLDPGVEVAFETAEDGPGGIELLTEGFKVAWTVEEYLESAQARIQEALEPPGDKGEARGDSEAGSG